MNLLSIRRSKTVEDLVTVDEPSSDDDGYEPPLVFDLGRVRDLTLGSSSSGNADSNSQYYW